MTTDNWLTVALIITNFIALLIGPVIAALIMSRISQPKPSPVVSQQKNQIQRIGGWLIRVFRSPWKTSVCVVLPSTVFNIYVLLGQVRSTAPVTPKVVLLIIMPVGGILLNIVSLGTLFIWHAIERQTDAMSKQSDTVSSLIDLFKTFRDVTEVQIDDLRAQMKALTPTRTLETGPNKPTQGTLRKLLAGIKILLGD